MAMDLIFSEASPRYSFSHDINPSSLVSPRSDTCPLDTSFDFEFGICKTLDQESPSADELFSQGILLPIQLREKVTPLTKQSIDPNPSSDQQEIPIVKVSTQAAVMEELKENLKEAAPLKYLESEEKSQSKSSFWSFKRSSSLNCDGEYKRTILCSLQGLSRSNSTGSVPKKTTQNKDKATITCNSSKHPPLPKSSSTSSSSSSTSLSGLYQYHQKSQNSKGYYGGSSYGSGGSRANSVLNVPPPYISNTNLFGLGSLFRNGKDKKPKK